MPDRERNPRRSLSCLLGGAVVGVIGWLVLVPWDLSEVDANGQLLDPGGDDHAGGIGAVALVVSLLGTALEVNRPTRARGAWFTAGGLWAWTILFTWRAGSAETVGANLFLAPVIVIMVPTAIAVPVAMSILARRLDPRS